VRRVAADSVEVVSAGPEHGALLASLFERADVRCYCRYWHFEGSTNGWLDRSAHAPEQSRGEMIDALATRSDEMSGVVALSRGAAVGWLKLAPASAVPKLYDRRPYHRLPCFQGPRDGVFVVGCLLVDPSERRRGVARALLDGAIELAERRGARAIEAFPRRAEGTRDEDVWMGPFSLFASAGFEIVHDFGPYPVLRLRVPASSRPTG